MNDASKLTVRRWAFERMMYDHGDKHEAPVVLQHRDVVGVDGCEQGKADQHGDVPVVALARLDDRKGGDYTAGSRLLGFPKKFSFLRKEP